MRWKENWLIEGCEEEVAVDQSHRCLQLALCTTMMRGLATLILMMKYKYKYKYKCCFQLSLCTTVMRGLATFILMMKQMMVESARNVRTIAVIHILKWCFPCAFRIGLNDLHLSDRPLRWGGESRDLGSQTKFPALNEERSVHRPQEPRRQLRSRHHRQPRGHRADSWTGGENI